MGPFLIVHLLNEYRQIHPGVCEGLLRFEEAEVIFNDAIHPFQIEPVLYEATSSA